MQAIWTPTPEQVAAANLTQFREQVNARHSLHLADYEALYCWSLEQPAAFWSEVAGFNHVKFSRRGETVLENASAMPGAKWFPGSRLNFAENLLRYRDGQPAIVFTAEKGERIELSYRELYSQVAKVAGWLKAQGVNVGDRVAGYMPNRPETLIAMLAATSLGAVWSSCSPDFGSSGLLDRFGQIGPKVLFAADGYYFKGKPVDALETVGIALREIPSLEKVVVIPWLSAVPDLRGLEKTLLYPQVLATEAGGIEFVQLPFDHPVYIMFSSGTTGKPKCIVHGAGGTLLQHLKELTLHTGLQRGERIFYFTTCGWMMWNWLVSSLAVGATVVLFDGSPFWPQPERLMDMAEEENINVFGTSAKYLSALEKAGVKPRETHKLDGLRAILSTGSPLLPESYDYVYGQIKADVQLASISGGTDIISCFALGNPVLPVYRGQLQCRGLGMQVEVYNEDAQPVEGEKGELVCTAPFPSMPVGFWNDPDGGRYHAAYFERFPNVWTHGDYAEITPQGGVIIHGRSDAVLNPGGVRIGTAEIYRQVEKLEEVLESVVVGQDWEGDVRVILFVVLRGGIKLDDDLRQRIRGVIRANATPRHVPAKIIQVADIPRTRNAKLAELAVRDVIHGREVKNKGSLANPEALELFKDLFVLQN